MGVNYSTGVLYGVDLGDLDGWDAAPAWMLNDAGDVDDWDPEEFLAGKLGGWTDMPYPEHLDRGAPGYDRSYQERDAWEAQKREHPDYRAWSANLDRKREIVAAADFGCSIDSYGHSEGDLTLLVKVDASEVSSDIWTAKPLDSAVMVADTSEWERKLARYLDALEIPAEPYGEPGWLLVGSVG